MENSLVVLFQLAELFNSFDMLPSTSDSKKPVIIADLVPPASTVLTVFVPETLA